MNILLIGAAGYIGSNVSSLLHKEATDDYVLVIDNFSTGYKQALIQGVDWAEVDVRNYEQLDSIFRYKQFDIVMDFSALTVVSESVSEPLMYYDDNFVGTLNILRCMREHNVPNIIFSSTAAVYGNPTEMPVKEDSPTNPINPYGSSKLFSERAIKDAAKAYGINYVIFRYFNVAGASDDFNYGFFRPNPTLLIPALNNAIILNRQFHIFGDNYNTPDGTCIRDYIHVVDLAKAHLLAIRWMYKNNKSETFNLGSKAGFSVKEVIDAAEEALNVKLNIEIKEPRPGDPAKLITNNEKAKNILGWEPKKTLKEMIVSDHEFRLKHIFNNSEK